MMMWPAAAVATLALAAVGASVASQDSGAGDPRRFHAPPCGSPRAERVAVADPPTADMYGTSELRPAGAHQPNGAWMGWALSPRIYRGNAPPPGWPSLNAWGQVFISEAGSSATNVRVEVRAARLFVRPKATGRWCLLGKEDAPTGGFFRTDFANNTSVPGDQRVEPDGGRSFRPVAGRAIHFYTGHYKIPEGGLDGVYTDFEARLIPDRLSDPDDRRLASIVASAGSDYKQFDDGRAPSGPVLGEVGIGRFRQVTNRWSVHSMNSAAPGAARKPID